jgi:hypothetical protein
LFYSLATATVALSNPLFPFDSDKPRRPQHAFLHDEATHGNSDDGTVLSRPLQPPSGLPRYGSSIGLDLTRLSTSFLDSDDKPRRLQHAFLPDKATHGNSDDGTVILSRPPRPPSGLPRRDSPIGLSLTRLSSSDSIPVLRPPLDAPAP